MPSMSKPMGKIPDTKVEAKSDVKPTVEKVEDTSPSNVEPDFEAKAEDSDVTEDDLKDLQEQQKIPYTRFKEKNQEAKRLRQELAESQKRYQEDMQRLISEREALREMRQKQDPTDILDFSDPAEQTAKELKKEIQDMKRELVNLKGLTAEQRMQAQLKELKDVYPKADTLAVLGWKKLNPSEDLAELMEKSHTRNVEMIAEEVKGIITKKKERKKSSFPSVNESYGLKIKESERPKTVKEASSLLKRFLQS